MQPKPRLAAYAILASAIGCRCALAGDSPSLAGIHWYGYRDYGVVNSGAEDLLDSMQAGAWDTEIVNTHGPVFQNASYFQPLYSSLYSQKNISIITRVEYEYGQTVPSPSTISAASWAGNVQGLVNTLKDGGHLWQLGNEPNLTGEAGGWTNNHITPAGYADLYAAVRASLGGAQVGAPGAHKLIVAPVSPGDVAGPRWISGTDWLGQTLDAIKAAGTPVDGIALHSYGGSLVEFRKALADQIAVIDAKGFTGVPLYITEWNRFSTPVVGVNSSAEETAAADFARGGFDVVDRWNRTPGNHNIKSLNWFVFDPQDPPNTPDGTGTWDGYSLKWWQTHGNPQGSSGDLYTAYQQAVDRRYSAGLDGTRPPPAGVSFIDNFETGDGRFTFSPTQSGTTLGVLPSSFKVRESEEQYTGSFGMKIGLVDDPARTGWRMRFVSGTGTPANNQPINLTSGTDGYIGFFLKVFTINGAPPTGSPPVPMTVQLILDSGTVGGGNDSDAGALRTIIADGEWHLYQWNLDSAADWVSWEITGSDGKLGTGANFTGQVTVDSLYFKGGDYNVEFIFDSLMRNTNGDLSSMNVVPEPAGLGAAGIAAGMSGMAARARRPR